MENEEKVILFVCDTKGKKEESITKALEDRGYKVEIAKEYMLALQKIRNLQQEKEKLRIYSASPELTKKNLVTILVKEIFGGSFSYTSTFLKFIRNNENLKNIPIICLYQSNELKKFLDENKDLNITYLPYLHSSTKDVIDEIGNYRN